MPEPEHVSLVIPGRNCAHTLRHCLDAATPLLDQPDNRLAEILFVDDGSTDESPEIAREFPVRIVPGEGRGPGAARNLGWRAARSPLVWFVDADCVTEPDALARLLPHMQDPEVGGASGSYGIMNPESLLARLIHEEIVERHRHMPDEVDFLATFNVLYRRAALEAVGGFDERYLKAQDAELSFRVMRAGYRLRFEFESRVRHFHETRWTAYLRTQRRQGYWRAWLHLSYPEHNAGDSYSNLSDHAQPPLALCSIAGLTAAWLPWGWTISAAPIVALLGLQTPLTWRLIRRLRRPEYLMFALMSFLRAYWRGVGLAHGLLAAWFERRRGPKPTPENQVSDTPRT